MNESESDRRHGERRNADRESREDRRQDQRRLHSRESTNIPVEIYSSTGSMEGSIVSVSPGGSAVEFSSALGKSNPAFDIGMNVELTASKENKLNGSVVRHYDEGIAVKFTDTANVLELLNNIISDS